MAELIEMTGRVFGLLTVQSRNPQNRGTRAVWNCVCVCGSEIVSVGKDLRNGKIKSCGNRALHWSGSSSANYLGGKHVTGSLWATIRSSAEGRSIPFLVSLDYAEELLVKQEFKCYYTNLPIVVGKKIDNRVVEERTASLDRIDSNLGYVEGNVRWVHKSVNLAKHVQTHEDFILLCNLVARSHPRNLDQVVDGSS